jgi:hypothetical protein
MTRPPVAVCWSALPARLRKIPSSITALLTTVASVRTNRRSMRFCETLEQRLQPYRLGLDRVALLLNTQRIDQLIELLRQLCGRSLTAFEISPLGTGRQFLRRQLE